MDPTAVIGGLINLILRTIKLLQEVTGKSREEVLDAIKAESAKTDALLQKLQE